MVVLALLLSSGCLPMLYLATIFHSFFSINGNTSIVENKAPLSQIKVLPFKEKNEWNMVAKYNIGKKPEDSKSASTTV